MTELAVVTGANSGIGLATALSLAHAGYRVFAGARRVEGLEAIAQAASDAGLSDTGGQAGIVAVMIDVTDDASVSQAFEQILAEGAVAVLVNNAGITGAGSIEETPVDEYQAMFDTNVLGVIRCTQQVLPGMRQAQAGSIVNISSAAGRFGFPLRSPYSASKFGVIGLTETWAMELGPQGIRVNAILPGIVEGPRQDRVLSAKAKSFGITLEQMRTRALERVSLRTTVTAHDIAAQIVFICSKAGAKISGQSLSVDGNVETLVQ